MRLRLAFAALGFVMTGCRIDNLTKPPGPLMPVGAVQHSVELGSLLVPVETLLIRNAGGSPTPWVAHATGGSAWLSLPKTSGFTPDTLYVQLHPSGLSVGVYRDTVIVSAVTIASSIAVPVELGIAIPPPPPIDTGVPPHLAFTTQPSNTTAGVSITPPVVICMYDKFGNVNTSFTGSITIAVNSGTLMGTVTVIAVAGCAMFTNLALATAGTYTLIGSANPPYPFIPATVSDSFTVTQ